MYIEIQYIYIYMLCFKCYHIVMMNEIIIGFDIMCIYKCVCVYMYRVTMSGIVLDSMG